LDSSTKYEFQAGKNSVEADKKLLEEEIKKNEDAQKYQGGNAQD
jgi:hypothetical protein